MTVRRLATVRVRVTLAAVVTVGVALAFGGAWLVRAHRSSQLSDARTAAELRARDVTVEVEDGGPIGTLAATRRDTTLAQVTLLDGTVVASSPNIPRGVRVSTFVPTGSAYVARHVDSLPFEQSSFELVVHRTVTNAGETYVVYAAQNLEFVERSTSDLIQLLLLGLPGILALVAIVTWLVSGRALRPVESIRREVEAIGAGALDRRVPEPRTIDEIGRLARTMNAMLARLQEATDRQRRFVADASHELRSPLTGIRTQLEVDLAHPGQANWQQTERDVLDDAIRLQRLVADLLTLAAVDDPTRVAEPFAAVDLDEIVLREARRLRSRTAVHLDTTGVSGAQVHGNPDQLSSAVRNLLDNGARHASTGVKVTLEETDCTVVLVVSDDGPGVPDSQREHVFARFARLDDARACDTGGTGLGLSITDEVVRAHGGTITLTNDPGACFTVRLPIAQSGIGQR